MTQVEALPRLDIAVNGVLLPAESGRALGEVRVRQRLSLPSLCELTFSDPPGPLTASDILIPGATLRIQVRGYNYPLFAGQVTAVEHVYGPARTREVHIRAYDLLHVLRKRQSVRAHVQVTAGELAEEMVKGLGLRVLATNSGPLWPSLYQHRQSDLELLVDVTERCGLYPTIRDDALYLITLEGIGEPIPLSLGESLLEARLELNGDPACRSVGAAGWDPLSVEAHRGQSDRARVGRRVAARIAPERLGGSGRREMVDVATRDAGQATALTQAVLDRQVAREVTLWGVAAGDPRLCPGTPVDITGVTGTMAGRHVLTEVDHLINARLGFISELATTPPEPRRQRGDTVLTLGVVTRIEDPDHAGRVRARLPAFGDVESEWMGVLTAGAGRGKGLVLTPDEGDSVLVLLDHGDPGRSIILGGLYGLDGPPDSGVEDGSVQRFTFLTPGGQRLLLDDGHQIARLENSDGSYIELAPEGVRLHAATDLTIEAPGQTVIIRGAAVDFQQE